MNRDRLKLRKDSGNNPNNAATLGGNNPVGSGIANNREFAVGVIGASAAGGGAGGGGQGGVNAVGNGSNSGGSTARSGGNQQHHSRGSPKTLRHSMSTTATTGFGLGSNNNLNHQHHSTSTYNLGGSNTTTTSTNTSITQYIGGGNTNLLQSPLEPDSKKKMMYTYKYDTKGPLWALSASPDFSMVAVVGREVLKVLKVGENAAEEFANLKTVGPRNNFGGSMDVKWGPTSGNSAKIATLGTNGPIVIWDVGAQNRLDRTLRGHSRAVNRISFSLVDPNLLLSASQDGTVRLWDLRVRDKPGMIMESRGDSVREVQFNPLSTHDIVAGYESGNLQRWDLRNGGTSVRKFVAHIGLVTSLDFHPGGRFLASGGREKTIKVWDMERDKRKEIHEIHTIHTIQYTVKVQWRPGKPFHLAACFKDESTVQIYDVRRPFVPLHVMSQSAMDATCILWKDTDVIWTVSKDKSFTSTYVPSLLPSTDMLSGGSAAINCYGHLAFAAGTKGGLESFERDLVVNRSDIRPVALDGHSEPMIYKTNQIAGVIDGELFNHDAFKYCAQNYIIDGGNLKEACEHNSNVAWHAGKYRDSQTWTALKLFFEENNDPIAITADSDAATIAGVIPELTTTSATPVLFGNSTMSNGNTTTIEDKRLARSNGTNGKGRHDTAGDDSDSDTDRQQTRFTVPSLFAIKVSDTPIVRDWSPETTIRNILEQYAENGEVQMCITILLVLREESERKDKRMPEVPKARQWFSSYIELLQRFKLWSIATAVAQACTDPSIHTMNQDSTTIHTACYSCLKPILTRAPTSTGFWACERCQKVLSSCAVCHKTVRGIFTWCAQCSHGFHLKHAQEWFSQSYECPSGCGHACFPELFMYEEEQQEQLLVQQQLQEEENENQQHQHHQHQLLAQQQQQVLIQQQQQLLQMGQQAPMSALHPRHSSSIQIPPHLVAELSEMAVTDG